MREKEGTLQLRNDRCLFHPFGLYGGKPGHRARNVLNPETTNEALPGKVTRTVKQGDVIRYDMAGAGGWGDPLERDVARVLDDVRNEYVSVEAARDEYGVILDKDSWTVDEKKTAEMRRVIRDRRGWAKPPFIDRGELPAGIRAPNDKLHSTN
jgi:N-methylhydantoinase B